MQNNWHTQLNWLDNPTQHPENIDDKDLLVRLLTAVLYTGNAYDSDDAADWQRGNHKQGAAVYEAASAALKALGAEHVMASLGESGEYTFGIDTPAEAEVLQQLERSMDDNTYVDDETGEQCIYEGFVQLSWDGAKHLNLRAEDSLTSWVRGVQMDRSQPWADEEWGMHFHTRHNVWLGMTQEEMAAVAKLMAAQLAQLKAQQGMAAGGAA